MVYCLILCGGAGTRFWPFSRKDRPKQFLDFLGTGRSLLQMTADRLGRICPPENVMLVTNSDYVDLIREQLPDIPAENLLLEPARRNTAPCICWAAHHIYARDPEAVIVTLPSDHLILKHDEFDEAMNTGIEFVQGHDALLTLGIRPRSPHTGYGYIQAKLACVDAPEVLKVKSFTEKPSEDMAKLFISTGEFYWNSGIFIWKARDILQAFHNYAPEIAHILHAPEGVYGSDREAAFIQREFPNAPSISIDYAIMEKAPNVYMLPVDLGWSDLGTWKSLYETSPHNREGNVTQNCKLIANNCTDSVFAVTGDKIIVAVGLENYIVADNDNALLICPIEDEQRIRQVVHDVQTRFGEEYV